MSKTLVVFGATGQQGGSVVEHVLNDSTLSKEYKIRAVTRDPSAQSAQALKQKGVEVVKGDADDASSLKGVMQGAHSAFVITATVYDQHLYTRELAQGKAIGDAAVAAGLQYLIFSTLAAAKKISGGKLQNMAFFDVKADIEEYIRSLPIKSAFFAPGSFMQNYAGNMAPRPSPANDGTYAIANFVSPDTLIPLIDTSNDTGKYVGAILANPDKYQGKVFTACTKLYKMSEVTDIMSKASGKTINYAQMPLQVWSGFLPPPMAGPLVDMFTFIQDYGYYGPDTKKDVEWTVQQVPGLTTLEEYLKRCPLQL